MLVELAELPVNGVDVHVVVLLEVVSEQVQRVRTGLQPLLVLVDLLHLKDRTDTVSVSQFKKNKVVQKHRRLSGDGWRTQGNFSLVFQSYKHFLSVSDVFKLFGLDITSFTSRFKHKTLF